MLTHAGPGPTGPAEKGPQRTRSIAAAPAPRSTLAATVALVAALLVPVVAQAQGANAAGAPETAPRSAITYSAWQAAEAAKARATAEAAAASNVGGPRALRQPLRASEPPLGALPPAQAPDLAPHAKAVHEDAQVRIEESKQRGQLRDVQVKSKLPHVPGYEIQLGGKGRDPSQDTGSRGKRTWSVFDF